MRITIHYELDESQVDEISQAMAENWPEGCDSMRCVKYDYKNCIFEFEDLEDDTLHLVDRAKLRRGFELLINGYASYAPPVPSVPDHRHWHDWLCQCDGETFDALAQLCCFDDVIYG